MGSSPAPPVQRASRRYPGHIFLSVSWSNVKFIFRRFSNWIVTLGFHLATRHTVEQNKCKHDPKVTKTNKIRAAFNAMNLIAFVFGRFGKSRRGYSKLGTFFESSRIFCTRHSQAIFFSPPNYQQFVSETGLSICQCRATPYNHNKT